MTLIDALHFRKPQVTPRLLPMACLRRQSKPDWVRVNRPQEPATPAINNNTGNRNIAAAGMKGIGSAVQSLPWNAEKKRTPWITRTRLNCDGSAKQQSRYYETRTFE
jgi:hypothetical protein